MTFVDEEIQKWNCQTIVIIDHWLYTACLLWLIRGNRIEMCRIGDAVNIWSNSVDCIVGTNLKKMIIYKLCRSNIDLSNNFVSREWDRTNACYQQLIQRCHSDVTALHELRIHIGRYVIYSQQCHDPSHTCKHGRHSTSVQCFSLSLSLFSVSPSSFIFSSMFNNMFR